MCLVTCPVSQARKIASISLMQFYLYQHKCKNMLYRSRVHTTPCLYPLHYLPVSIQLQSDLLREVATGSYILMTLLLRFLTLDGCAEGLSVVAALFQLRWFLSFYSFTLKVHRYPNPLMFPISIGFKSKIHQIFCHCPVVQLSVLPSSDELYQLVIVASIPSSIISIIQVYLI